MPALNHLVADLIVVKKKPTAIFLSPCFAKASILHKQGARGERTTHPAYNGASKKITLKIPTTDEHGQIALREHTIEFNIPRGVYAGQRIRLAGQGGAGMGQGKAGDLYLEVEFRQHLHYRIDKHDVYLDLPITPWEAALGAEIEVPTPSGFVELKIPAGSASDRKLRLKGRGIPSRTPGDFYFVLKIALPPAESEADKSFYQGMNTHFKSFNPRTQLGAGA